MSGIFHGSTGYRGVMVLAPVQTSVPQEFDGALTDLMRAGEIGTKAEGLRVLLLAAASLDPLKQEGVMGTFYEKVHALMREQGVSFSTASAELARRSAAKRSASAAKARAAEEKLAKARERMREQLMKEDERAARGEERGAS